MWGHMFYTNLGQGELVFTSSLTFSQSLFSDVIRRIKVHRRNAFQDLMPKNCARALTFVNAALFLVIVYIT